MCRWKNHGSASLLWQRPCLCGIQRNRSIENVHRCSTKKKLCKSVCVSHARWFSQGNPQRPETYLVLHILTSVTSPPNCSKCSRNRCSVRCFGSPLIQIRDMDAIARQNLISFKFLEASLPPSSPQSTCRLGTTRAPVVRGHVNGQISRASSKIQIDHFRCGYGYGYGYERAIYGWFYLLYFREFRFWAYLTYGFKLPLAQAVKMRSAQLTSKDSRVAYHTTLRLKQCRFQLCLQYIIVHACLKLSATRRSKEAYSLYSFWLETLK